ncbi:MAG: hypothetical protein K2I90_07575 [Odoribacter sp.]|nr:hypothetical protein [Odoribacter sp.]
MEGNLTLKINESILKKAVGYAQKNKIDLSVVIEDFLVRFSDETTMLKRKVVISDEVQELVGILSATEQESWKEERANYLVEKYK